MDRNREPRAHEAHLYSEIYIDETSQTDHHFLVIGGIMLPRKYSDQFEQDVIAARLPRLPLLRASGKPREAKWSEFGKGDLETYKRIVDAFFRIYILDKSALVL